LRSTTIAIYAVSIEFHLTIEDEIATAVHEQKLVHRDITSTNIMVSLKDNGRVIAKIIDLGLAKTVNEPLSEAAISVPGALLGHHGLPVRSNLQGSA
jgi:serine/threonine protein kinase